MAFQVVFEAFFGISGIFQSVPWDFRGFPERTNDYQEISGVFHGVSNAFRWVSGSLQIVPAGFRGFQVQWAL